MLISSDFYLIILFCFVPTVYIIKNGQIYIGNGKGTCLNIERSVFWGETADYVRRDARRDYIIHFMWYMLSAHQRKKGNITQCHMNNLQCCQCISFGKSGQIAWCIHHDYLMFFSTNKKFRNKSWSSCKILILLMQLVVQYLQMPSDCGRFILFHLYR